MSVLKSIARAAIRIVVALLFIAVPLVLFKLAIIPGLGLDREMSPTQAITRDSVAFYVNVGITLLISVLGFWSCVRIIERRPVVELSFRFGATVIGLTSGIFLIGLPIAVLYLTGHYEAVSFKGFSGATFAIVLIVTFAVVLEEIIFRGVIFAVRERHFGTIAALVLQSIVFSVVHLANDNWAGFLPVLSGFLIGCLWTSLYIVFRKIWVVALHHAAWNLAVFATGLPLSGIEEWRQAAPLHSEFHGSVLMAGGLSGPEVSILTPFVVILAFGIVLYYARQKKLIRPAVPTVAGAGH